MNAKTTTKIEKQEQNNQITNSVSLLSNHFNVYFVCATITGIITNTSTDCNAIITIMHRHYLYECNRSIKTTTTTYFARSRTKVTDFICRKKENENINKKYKSNFT